MNTLQTAARIACNLQEGDYVAVTLQGGYAIRRDGSRYLFEACKGRIVRRNKKSRVIYLVGTYRDGSAISYTWSESRGARYFAQNHGVDELSEYPDNED